MTHCRARIQKPNPTSQTRARTRAARAAQVLRRSALWRILPQTQASRRGRDMIPQFQSDSKERRHPGWFLLNFITFSTLLFSSFPSCCILLSHRPMLYPCCTVSMKYLLIQTRRVASGKSQERSHIPWVDLRLLMLMQALHQLANSSVLQIGKVPLSVGLLLRLVLSDLPGLAYVTGTGSIVLIVLGYRKSRPTAPSRRIGRGALDRDSATLDMEPWPHYEIPTEPLMACGLRWERARLPSRTDAV
jgi:hypothetical protein